MTTHVTEPAAADALEAPSSGLVAAARNDASASRATWVGLCAVGLLAVLVFWVFEALPFQDLPAHAGLIALRHRFAESPFEQRFFVHAPHLGPYSLFRFLGELFVRVVGPLGAVRALATLPVLATPIALLFARRRLFDDRSATYGFLGLALSFGFMTLLGFASYLLGVAVMLFAVVAWLELLAAVDDGAKDLRKRELAMTALAPLVFVAHGHAFVLFLLCAGISAICTGRRFARVLRILTLGPALGLAGWVAWIERAETTPGGSVAVTAPMRPMFQSAAAKFELLVTPTLMTRMGVDFLVAIFLWAFALACTVYTVRSLATSRALAPLTQPADARHARALLSSAGALTVLFLLLPHQIGWFGFVDGRLLPVILMLAMLGTRRDALPVAVARIGDVGVSVAAASMATVALVASYFFQQEAHGYREVLAHVPAEATLLNLPIQPNSEVFTGHPFIHYDKLALAERPIVVSDVWFHQGTALYPTKENPALRLPSSYSESDLKFVDWPAYHLEDWDFVLIRTQASAPAPYTPKELVLAEHVGGWWLFKRAAPAASR
jgi:hypothetical protein